MPGIVIEDALAAWIEEQPEALALEAKVYPFASAPQGTGRPYVTYHRVAGGRLKSLTGPSGVSHPRIQLDFWGRDYKQVKRLHQATTQTGTQMQGRTVQVAEVLDEFDNPDAFDTPPRHGDELAEYRLTIDLKIWFVE